jgi:hypothetical protein
MELDDSKEALDWEDDLDEAEIEDEFDAMAEFEAESHLGREALRALGLGPMPR